MPWLTQKEDQAIHAVDKGRTVEMQLLGREIYIDLRSKGYVHIDGDGCIGLTEKARKRIRRQAQRRAAEKPGEEK